MQELQTLVSDFEKLSKEFEKKASSTLAESFKKIFEEVPALEAVRWEQYTPGFNDGDPCLFSITEPRFKFSKDLVTKISDEEREDYEDDFTEAYQLNNQWLRDHGIDPYDNDGKHEMPYRKVLTSVTELIQSKGLRGVLESVYGESTRITITRKGVEVDDYDCGY